MDPFLPDDRKVAAVRALLPATGAGIALDTPTAGPLPGETATALREADDWELRVGRGGPDHAADAALRREEAAGVLAAVLGVAPGRVVPVMGVATATAAVLGCVRGGGPLALVPGLDPAVEAAARAVAGARGWAVTEDTASARIVLAPAVRADDGDVVDLAGVRAGMDSTGLLVADLTLAAGVLAGTTGLVAGVADAAILATDRWLLGPDGTAAIVLGDEADEARRLADPLPRRAALGLGRSVGWLLMYVGLPWAVERAGVLAARLRAALVAIPGVRVRGAGGSATLAFTVDEWTPDEAADELGRRVFAITGRTPDGSALRVGVGAWTTEEELDRFARAVAELAAHTPATLPRRPVIEVLGG
ncbi:MAG: hypothetical protein U0869_24280 [Chloroflexota bacterium]